MAAQRHYDQRYFDKWYRNPRYRVKSPPELARQVAFVLSAAEHILGYMVAEMPGQPLPRIFTPADRERGVPSRECAGGGG